MKVYLYDFFLFLNFDLDFNEAILAGTPLLFGAIAWFEFDWLYLIMLKQIFLDYKLYYLLKKIRFYGEVDISPIIFEHKC